MSENGENVCEICSQEISEDNRASFTNDLTSTIDVERVICNECFADLHGESSKVKFEEVPISLIKFNTDIPKIVEMCCETNSSNFNQCGYSITESETVTQLVVINQDNHDEVFVKEEVSVKDEDLEDVKLLKLIEINRDIHKIIEEPCENNLLYCYYCGFSMANKTTLIKHFQRCKRNGEKHYNCDICDYSNAESDDLKRHMYTHTGQKSYKSKVCNFSSVTSNTLKQHMHTLTDEKLYKCKICDYSTKRSDSLTIHMRTHTGEKPYKCKLCNYSAIKLGHLNVHMYTHTGEKPYKCKLCNYTSSYPNALKVHIRSHTGEKPYKCKICEYSCKQSGLLTTHMRKHTGEKPYKCKICEYSCKQSRLLTTHMRKHTGEKF